MNIRFVLPFLLIFLFGCQNENPLMFEWPKEAVISLEQDKNFTQHIQIIGQHAYNSETYYFIFEGTLDNKKEWFVADVKKDLKVEKWYVNSSINIDADENSKSGTDTYRASIVPKDKIAEDDQLIIETSDSEYNVLVDFGTN